MTVWVSSISNASVSQRLSIVTQTHKFSFVASISYLAERPRNMREPLHEPTIEVGNPKKLRSSISVVGVR